MTDNYVERRSYVGTGGIIARVEPIHLKGKHLRWAVRVEPSHLKFSAFISKFEALLFASHQLRRSMKYMDWRPI